jgi:di/tricarboxylate transporter
MTGFIVIGVVGLLIVLLSLVLGEVLDGVFEALDFDVGGGLFSAPVIGSFLAAFGFGAALVMYGAGTSAAVGALGGLGSGILIGAVTLAMTRFFMNMPTDEPVRVTELVGQRATVVTPIPETGLGEVTLVFRGQMLKLSARADAPMGAGRSVVVAAVTSPSSVLVRPADPA